MNESMFELKSASGRLMFRVASVKGAARLSIAGRILTISSEEAVALGEWLIKEFGDGPQEGI